MQHLLGKLGGNDKLCVCVTGRASIGKNVTKLEKKHFFLFVQNWIESGIPPFSIDQ
jgi:hypothetical protein